jgi:hypothetical protein
MHEKVIAAAASSMEDRSGRHVGQSDHVLSDGIATQQAKGVGNPDSSSVLALRTMMRYALERESDRGSAFAVLVELSKREEMSISDLCREFGVSRPTGYRWINRHKDVGHKDVGPEGLLNRSRRLRLLDFSNVKTVRCGFFESVRVFLSDSDRRTAWGKNVLIFSVELSTCWC